MRTCSTQSTPETSKASSTITNHVHMAQPTINELEWETCHTKRRCSQNIEAQCRRAGSASVLSQSIIMNIPYSVMAGGMEYEDGTSIIRVPIIRGYPKLDQRKHIQDAPFLFSYQLLDASAPPLRHNHPRRSITGITKQYLKVGQSAKNRLFGVGPQDRWADDRAPLQMLVSDKGGLSRTKAILMIMGVFLIVVGTILSSVPLVEFILFKNLRLLNGTLAHQYWQRPGVLRLTKVYVFNVTNPDGIVYRKEKPRLEEVGPFVYSEDMQKVNVKFHDNGTVTYQHNKILQFRPELSGASQSTKLVLPNIPVLTATSMSVSFGIWAQTVLHGALTVAIPNNQPFTSMTAEQLLFGYNDPFILAAHYVFPKHLRPKTHMGLLLGRNGTLDEVSTINSGRDDMSQFGLLERLNGKESLPMWKESPCNSIRASEGSFFPPRSVTGSDKTAIYDKDLCRILPLERRSSESIGGIPVDVFTPPENVYDSEAEENKCFCSEGYTKLDCPVRGLQDISPCQFNAPVYMSNPHFLDADPSLGKAVEGLKPNKTLHQTYLKINPRVGVPLEAKVRIQINFMPTKARFISCARNFPEIAFPILWLEEGIDEVTTPIKRWIFLANIADLLVDVAAYGSLILGFGLLIGISTYTYRKQVFTKENIEKVPRAIRRGSSFIVNGQHRLLIIRDSYTLLNTKPDSEMDPDPDRDSS